MDEYRQNRRPPTAAGRHTKQPETSQHSEITKHGSFQRAPNSDTENPAWGAVVGGAALHVEPRPRRQMY